MASFRFLDLPNEIGLMVYERLHSTIRHNKVGRPDSGACAPEDLANFGDAAGPGKAAEDIQATVTTDSFPVAIRATYKAIHQEAKPVVAVELQKLAQAPVRMIISSATFARGLNTPRKCVMSAIFKPYALIRKPFLTRNAFPNVPGKAAIEIAFPTSNPPPSGKHLLLALLTSWTMVQTSNVSVNVFCHDPLSHLYDRRALAMGVGDALRLYRRGSRRGGASSYHELEVSKRRRVGEA
jgi:hypothetical protein